MKIVENKKNNYIKFEDLEPGEAFKCGNTYYLKIEDVVNKECWINAVTLDDGRAALFYKYDDIIPINANLVIDED